MTAIDPKAAVFETWRNVDWEAGRDGELRWTEDCVYITPAIVIEGRDALREALGARTATGPRTTRHLVTNATVTWDGPDRAVVSYYLTLFGADGEPVLPMDNLPIAVGDVVDELVRRAVDEPWLIARRRWTPVFVAEAARSPFLTGHGLPTEARRAS